MKCEIERMEIIYTFYFFAFLKKVIKKLLTFCYWQNCKTILISSGARLSPFDIQELRKSMSYDEMELDMIGDQRTAMFVIISDTDDTFNFVVASCTPSSLTCFVIKRMINMLIDYSPC